MNEVAFGIKSHKTKTTSKDVLEFLEFLQHGSPGPNAYAILLGLRDFDSVRLVRHVEQGLSIKTFYRFLQNSSFSPNQLSGLVAIAPRTLTRRREEGRLTANESDRLLRTARVFARALELFDGDEDAAKRWLSSPQVPLGGAVPLSLIKTEVGSREVEAVISRIEHGVFS